MERIRSKLPYPLGIGPDCRQVDGSHCGSSSNRDAPVWRTSPGYYRNLTQGVSPKAKGIGTRWDYHLKDLCKCSAQGGILPDTAWSDFNWIVGFYSGLGREPYRGND